MAQWQRTLNLLPEWDTGDHRKVAAAAAERLRALKPLEDYSLDIEREDIADAFHDLSRDETATEAEFNEIMSDLYDWADTKISGAVFDAKKACWVKTF